VRTRKLYYSPRLLFSIIKYRKIFARIPQTQKPNIQFEENLKKVYAKQLRLQAFTNKLKHFFTYFLHLPNIRLSFFLLLLSFLIHSFFLTLSFFLISSLSLCPFLFYSSLFTPSFSFFPLSSSILSYFY